MSTPAARVHVSLYGETHEVGRLWIHSRRGVESASFSYTDEWLTSSQRFALDPALQLHPGSAHTRIGQALFGALGDSAPDRWGRTLIARGERMLARNEGRTPRTLREIDYLLGVSDETRQGALRFSSPDAQDFLAWHDRSPVPPLVDLPRLLSASAHVLEDSESASDLRLLLAPGSSLGGARPKASVRDAEGNLMIAKFPAPSDSHDVVTWEAIALELAKKAGIDVADSRIHQVDGRRVLLTKRFDRAGKVRIPFLSAMSALGANDGDVHSYLEIADALRTFAAAPIEDLAQLWRRVVFNVLISNTDDHLRNHAFVYVGESGWRLSPAYDLNPVPTDIKPRVLSTAIGEDLDQTASLELALAAAQHFGLKAPAAREIVRQVHGVVRGWAEQAVRLGSSAGDADRLSTAFEHVDATAAAAL